MKPQVVPDIRSVTEFADHVAVRGYQNYDVYSDRVEPLSGGKQHGWANTRAKFDAVQSAIAHTEGVKTYADLGCNLGLHVFAGALNHGFESVGFDFEEKYIDVCQMIAAKYNLPCTFTTKNFSEINKTYDLVSALGLIHHLYHHTETYGSLDVIIEHFAELTNKYLILEFPNENDPKTAKWVSMKGRIRRGEYSERALLGFSREHFSSIINLERVHPKRPMFLMVKGENSA